MDALDGYVAAIKQNVSSYLKAAPTLASGEYTDAGRAPSDNPVLKNGLVDLAATTIDQAKQLRLLKNADAALSVVTSLGAPLNDRELQLEKVVQMLQSLPLDSGLAEKLAGGFLGLLYKDLPHPPTVLVGAETRFRTADSSNNNIWMPELGKAGTPYSRTVTPLHPLPANLPDPGLVFDAVLRRRQFTPHPSGISSMMFAFATLIIHDIFRTKRSDPTINETSGYVDLSVLYGNDQETQNKVRAFKNGEMKPDTAAEDRLFMLPPPVAALLIVFSRNHNFICRRLLAVNERKQFRDWDLLDDEGKKWQDEELFQTARLLNNTFFIRIVLRDYLRSILGLTETASGWTLDPAKEIRNGLGGEVPRAAGNASSVEFSMLYRWHATISQADENWTIGVMKKFFPNKEPADVTMAEFAVTAHQIAAAQGADPSKWKIGELERNEDGYFDDNEIATILAKAVEEPAGAFKARGSPESLKCIDMAGIVAARSYHRVCTMNEFRQYLNLKPFESFEEWNSDKEIARAMEALYKHPDNMELYPALLAEESKPSIIGSGLAPGYTISRAILSDAVALVRGDRFLTTNSDTSTLTYHGYADVAANVKNGAYGGMLPKVLMRNLPNVFKFNSVYANFPMQLPARMLDNLTKIGVQNKYDFARPLPPPPMAVFKTISGIATMMADGRLFANNHDEALLQLTGHQLGVFPSIDDPVWPQSKRDLLHKVLLSQGWERRVQVFFANTTDRLLTEGSFQLSVRDSETVDIIYDVLNLVPIYWLADEFGISLKTQRTPHGIITPRDLLDALQTLHRYAYINDDPVESFELREKALAAATRLRNIVGACVFEASSKLLRSVLGRGLSDAAKATYERLGDWDHRDQETQTAIAMGLMISIGGASGAHLSRALDLFLPDIKPEPSVRHAVPHGADMAQRASQAAQELANSLVQSDKGAEASDAARDLKKSADTKKPHASRPPPYKPSEEEAFRIKDAEEKKAQTVQMAALAAAKLPRKSVHLAVKDSDMAAVCIEALRFDPPRAELRRKATAPGVARDGDLYVEYEKDTTMLLDIGAAHRSLPGGFRPGRRLDEYYLVGHVTKLFAQSIYPAVIANVLNLPGLQRAPGASGVQSSFKELVPGTDVANTVYIDSHSCTTPFPTSMMISYKGISGGGVVGGTFER